MLDDTKVLQRRQKSGLARFDLFDKADKSVQIRSSSGGIGAAQIYLIFAQLNY